VLMAFSRALLEVGKVGTYGANKYSPNGWMGVPNGKDRYTDAMFRHLFEEGSTFSFDEATGLLRAGVAIDEETGLLHAAQTAWNALARLELMLREAASNDRSQSVAA